MSYESPRIGKKGQPYETVTAAQHKEKKRREAVERQVVSEARDAMLRADREALAARKVEARLRNEVP